MVGKSILTLVGWRCKLNRKGDNIAFQFHAFSFLFLSTIDSHLMGRVEKHPNGIITW